MTREPNALELATGIMMPDEADAFYRNEVAIAADLDPETLRHVLARFRSAAAEAGDKHPGSRNAQNQMLANTLALYFAAWSEGIAGA